MIKTLKNHSVKVISLIIALCLVCIALCSCSKFYFESDSSQSIDEYLAVHFLDVGQGDSIFIEMPDSKTMLIDAGENMLGKSIMNYINTLGYGKIDYLVATHPHADHIGSMAYIVRNMDIGEIYMPKVSTTTKTYENLLESIAGKGLKVKSAKAGVSIIDTENFNVDIVAPATIKEDNLNNCSAVLKMTYGDTSFLFTGDAEEEELSEIDADISANVLKVGHHGSSTSTDKDFIKRVCPEIAVISLGADNKYGHPHKSTLKHLKNAGAEIYRTDGDGTVKITSDGENISVETGLISMEKDD